MHGDCSKQTTTIGIVFINDVLITNPKYIWQAWKYMILFNKVDEGKARFVNRI